MMGKLALKLQARYKGIKVRSNVIKMKFIVNKMKAYYKGKI